MEGRNYSLIWALVFALWLSLFWAAESQAQVIAFDYQFAGYAGPVGSDVSGDPLQLQALYRSWDEGGAVIFTIVPVEVDPASLDAAIEYAAFQPSVIGSDKVLPGWFTDAGMGDQNNDGIFSVWSVNPLNAVASFNCEGRTYSDLSECVNHFGAEFSAWNDTSVDVTMPQAPSGGVNGTTCTVPVRVSTQYQETTNISYTFTKSAGTSCAAAFAGLDISLDDYTGGSLIDFVPESARHYVIGDALAIAATVPELIPAELVAAGEALTAEILDPESACFEDPFCFYPGAYDEPPVYWREGYSFTPASGFGNYVPTSGGSGGGGEGITEYCDSNPDAMICADSGADAAIAAEPDDVPGEEITVEAAEVTGFAIADELGECPAPPSVPGVFTFDNTGLCNALIDIRPYMEMFGFVLYALILARGLRA